MALTFKSIIFSVLVLSISLVNGNPVTKTEKILRILYSKEYSSLTQFMGTNDTLYFSPYAQEKLKKIGIDKSLLKTFNTSKSKITWGVLDGSGFPIILEPQKFMTSFIYSRDYISKGNIIPIDSKNIKKYGLQEVYKAYPSELIILVHYPGTASIGFKDTRSLILIFNELNSKSQLLGLINSESMI